MAKFGNLRQFDPTGRTATMSLPIGYVRADGTTVQSKLVLAHAGDSNKRWQNAVNAHNAKTGLARKALSNSGEANALGMARDLDLYPKFIIQGWEDVVDDDGVPVAFSEENAREFLQALPQWIFDSIRLFAVQASNFVDATLPTLQEAKAAAGN